MPVSQAQVVIIINDARSAFNAGIKKSDTIDSYGFVSTGVYKLQGNVQVSGAKDSYDDPFKFKLTISGEGISDNDGRILLGPKATYQAAAQSFIMTTPVVQTISNTPIITGVTAGMNVHVGIHPVDPQGHPLLLAQAFVFDPYTFTNFPAEGALQISSVVQTGDSFSARGEDGVLHRTLVATTDIPGLETLYQLDIIARGNGKFTNTADDMDVEIDFTSNPALGISDSAVLAALHNALAYNAQQGWFEFTSDVPLFNGLVEIPDTVHDFHLALVEGSVAANQAPPPPGPGVPEPSWSSFVVALGALGTLTGARRRRRARSRSNIKSDRILNPSCYLGTRLRENRSGNRLLHHRLPSRRGKVAT